MFSFKIILSQHGTKTPKVITSCHVRDKVPLRRVLPKSEVPPLIEPSRLQSRQVGTPKSDKLRHEHHHYHVQIPASMILAPHVRKYLDDHAVPLKVPKNRVKRLIK